MKINQQARWTELQSLADQAKAQPIHQLFAQDPQRFQNFTQAVNGLTLDISKQRIDQNSLNTLITLARECQLDDWIKQLFDGAPINHTENRPALHTALRSPKNKPYPVLGASDISPSIHQSLGAMTAMVDKIRAGQWRSYSGDAINTVVNIGVGGSDLGPLMACKALTEFAPQSQDPIEVHFVSSLDGSQLSALLGQLNPRKTLFVLASKSFSTIDTLANAATAKEWLSGAANCSDAALIARHFIAVTASPDKASDWGIPLANQLEFWDWTGGRYSMWSTIGLPIALKLGSEVFYQMLAGAHDMDEHFRHSKFEQNLPVLLALVGIWNINFLDIHAHAILPYDGRLSDLPAYLEQLEMESNGKSTDREGDKVGYKTCPILWGEVGTNAQHAFYQLLHQGTEAVMCDFIVAAQRYQESDSEELRHQHTLNLSNCLAQSRILALGDSVLEGAEQAPNHKRYAGNQPCTTLLMDELNPFAFGQLIALYEHKVFVQSVIWNINPFDQWGVELGKKVATDLLQHLQTPPDENSGLDSSTQGLIQQINAANGAQTCK